MSKAVIFDMDGVISHTEILHGKIESMLLKQVGIDVLPKEILENYAGISDEDMFVKIFQKHNIPQNKIAKIIKKKWKLMDQITKEKIKPVAHAIKFINDLIDNKFILGVASASRKKFIIHVLKTLNILDKFAAIVAAEEVEYGKPAPDIFLLTAKRLNVNPAETVVIEDGKSGMIGAKRAGMKCIGLVKDKAEDYPATKIVTSLNQISVAELRAL